MTPCLQELLQSHRLFVSCHDTVAQESEAYKHVAVMIHPDWNLIIPNSRAVIVPEHEFMVVLPGVHRFLSRHAGQCKHIKLEPSR